MLRTVRNDAIATVSLAAVVATACASPDVGRGSVPLVAGVVGQDSIPVVRLMENHSSALIAWREAGVRDRVVVHLDGHSDLDWLPDETVARIAASAPDELHQLELHPYAMDGSPLDRFGIWNFLYPAARLGIAREIYWVVPDSTLEDTSAAWRLAREILTQKLERVRLDEATGLRWTDGCIRGELLSVAIAVCELDDLPAIDEPVLLDVDLDYFTTRSALTQEVTEAPWIEPEDVLDALRDRGIRADVATISLSTIGGYFPSMHRWMGSYLLEVLRDPGRRGDAGFAGLREGMRAADEGRLDDAVTAFRAALEIREESSAWHGLAHAMVARGEHDEAERVEATAIRLDPLLAHESLFDGDRHWLNGDWARALERYRAYLERLPVGPFTAYALRREGGSLMRLRRDDEARAVFERAIELAPSHPDTLLDLGVLERERGNVARALELFERARRTSPERSTFATALGNTYLVAGEYERAVGHLRAAVEAKPLALRPRVALATALLELGDLDGAQGHVRIALSIEPRHPQVRQLARVIAQRAGSLVDPGRGR